MSPLIELSSVSKVYKADHRQALDHVTVAIGAGEFAAVMGPSGGGKSTLLNVIAGLDRPSQGSVTVAGTELTHLSEAALARYRRESVGIIFQFFNLLPNLSVIDNVIIPAQLVGARQPRKRALDLLEQLGMQERLNQFPAKLSGGERQRVAIARALINSPQLLLADEPTGALDSQSGDEVIDMLLEVNRAGVTTILVTHDAGLARRCARRVISLIDGRLAQDEPSPLSLSRRTSATTLAVPQ
jgi:putative ABC transport system ATP-binding protein